MECILIKRENHYRVSSIDRTFYVKFYGFFLSLENLNPNDNITYPSSPSPSLSLIILALLLSTSFYRIVYLFYKYM